MKNPEAQPTSGDSLERDESEFNDDKTPLEEEKEPLDILQEGRAEIKNSPYVKELIEGLKALRKKHAKLEKQYIMRSFQIKENLVEPELKEKLIEETENLSKQLDENEAKRAEIEKEIQQMQDAIKKEFTQASKKQNNKK